MKLLESLKSKIDKVKSLIWRNKTLPTDVKLFFPFILVAASNSSDSTFDVSLNQDKLRVTLCSNKKMFLLGDCDVCSFLDFLKDPNKVI
jgi:hypothetical protein